ncbi:glycosyltransferase family protein [Mucilaginibacter glaciei]|uniref:Glycosyltransferase n=1 Tax=Mucilaginibacter glaciei TaxID=2772109 RepID=A0A926S172_9SPHI|nr:glycosyltransferase [Mucilaginibacter glaciei]MBD1391854.1 glycosyltransferase [Mucilaginibacter glaciei]
MSLKGCHIVFFSQMQFDGALESTNYTIARNLAKDNYVYYIDRPYTWKDYFKFKGTKSFNTRKSHFFSASNCVIQSDLPNLKIVICPPVPSINMLPEGPLYRLGVKFNERVVANRLKKVFKKYGVKDYIYINSYNFSYPTLQDLLHPDLSVYHCVDPIIEAYQLKHGLHNEDILLKDVDMVICTSRELTNKKALVNKHSYFVPNAANLSHSQKALDPNLPESAIFNGIKKPVIGYLGAIERRIDYEMMNQVLAMNTDKSFVFVGPVDDYYIKEGDFEAPNLSLPGAIPYDQMPAILKGFDIGIIPFKKDDVSNNIFPLKLFEYMGAGKPVVATNFNEDLKNFTFDSVPYCSTAEEFSAAINEALADTPEKQVARLKIAANNTWEHRIDQLKDILADGLAEKHKLAN